jgi:GT2 family glycosyltransferase
MIRPSSKKVVLLGMMTRIPVSGVVWQTVHYMLGFERLGYEAYYVETHARTPAMLMEHEQDDGSARAAKFIGDVMDRFGFGDRWAFYGLHADRRSFGMTRPQLRRLYGSAQLLINLHGGTEPLPELWATDRLVYLETDPVQLQLELAAGIEYTLDFLEPHCAFFSFAENLGAPDCELPVSDRFPMHPTRQPVICDLWRGRGRGGERLTTVGNWRQPWRDVTFDGDRLSWSKHQEFLRFIDLPSRTGQPIELALSSYEPEDREMLEQHGWHVRHALDFSTDADAYRDYIAGSRGEFTVAKEQNVRLRTGWFSDRSATYLAAGRPVISQETGFSNVFPTGEGLFGFDSYEEILDAIDQINSDYERHSRAAEEIAREYFAHDVVLGRLLDEVGVEVTSGRGYPVARRNRSSPWDPGLSLVPVSRRPTRLAPATQEAVLAAPVPTALVPRRWPGTPAASIVVVTYDNLAFTRMCLESVLANTEHPAFELIVVDNASTDGTRDYLASLAERNPHVRLVLNRSNVGFAAACNQGLALAHNELLVLLNNDAVVPPGWLARLALVLAEAAVGLAGPVTNRIGNEAEVETGYTTWGEFLAEAQARAVERQGEVFDIPTLTMFCLALRRDALERIGMLDTRFAVGMLEDDDYSLRAHEAGYRVVCCEDTLVHHFGESSFGKLVASGDYNRLLDENKARYEEKWGRPWEPYERRAKPRYDAATERIRTLVAERLPEQAVVAVVSSPRRRSRRTSTCTFPVAPTVSPVASPSAPTGSPACSIPIAVSMPARVAMFPCIVGTLFL